MQPRKPDNAEIEINPAFAYRSLHSNKQIVNHTQPIINPIKDPNNRFKSSEPKESKKTKESPQINDFKSNKDAYLYKESNYNTETSTSKKSYASKDFQTPKEFHPPGGLFRTPASKPQTTVIRHSYTHEHETTDIATSDISDIISYTNRPLKEIEKDEVSMQNYSTVGNISRHSINVFVKKRISRSPQSNHVPPPIKPSLMEQSNEYVINLEDLMLVEQKICDILHSIDNRNSVSNACFEWWNFYFNCSLNGNLESYFINRESKEIIQLYTNTQFLSIMLIYDLSFDVESFKLFNSTLKNLVILLQKSLLVVCDYILSKVKKEFATFVWVDKLRQLLKNNKGYMISPIHIDDIKYSANCAYECVKLLLANYGNHIPITAIFKKLYNELKYASSNDINKIFLGSVMRVSNPKGSVVASFLINSNENVPQISAPYIKTKTNKPYTLVLDLDETLMSFKLSNEDDTQGLMRLRPGLYDFLDSVTQFYELIIFTAATKDYADPILNAIEDQKHYFAYRLYREHAVIVKNDFVKDITRIGRDIAKTIIVDNMPQNFRLQKENGILILSFWGEDPEDIALFELEKILTKIAKDDNDVRISLRKYKDDITKNVSSKIYQN